MCKHYLQTNLHQILFNKRKATTLFFQNKTIILNKILEIWLAKLLYNYSG